MKNIETESQGGLGNKLNGEFEDLQFHLVQPHMLQKQTEVEKLSNLFKITWPVNGQPGTNNQVS